MDEKGRKKERSCVRACCACGEGGASEWAREKEKGRKRVREWEDERKSRGKRKKPAIEKKLLSLYIRINIITFHSFNPFSS